MVWFTYVVILLYLILLILLTLNIPHLCKVFLLYGSNWILNNSNIITNTNINKQSTIIIVR